MPRFYFDLKINQKYFRDDCGYELNDTSEALDEATGLLASSLNEHVPASPYYDGVCEVRDEEDRIVTSSRLKLWRVEES